ncbi:adaptin N terminal region-domain-containing protein, partial [Baffinella frigidus]
MKSNQTVEKQCTYLIYNEAVVRAEPGELAAGLENNDVREKTATMKKLIQLLLNGEQLGSLLMKVIQFIVPNEDKQLKKLLYLYLEAVEKRSPNGHLLPEMILICNMIRNDLNHPNEFVRGSALRFLSKIREKDILEPLVASLRVNLEHRHSYVRRNAVLAIYNTYKCFEDLMPDAPELIAEFIDGESDVSAKRNAFVMLCNCDQERAVAYQLSVMDQLSNMGDIIQLVMLELVRKVCRQDPFQKSKYVRAVFNLQSSASNSVAFECASTLVSLSSAATAVKTAVQAYCQLLSTHSDNNVKLIVLDKISDLQRKVPLHTHFRHQPNHQPSQERIAFFKPPGEPINPTCLLLLGAGPMQGHVCDAQPNSSSALTPPPPPPPPRGRCSCVNAIHSCVTKFPETSGVVVQVLIDFLDDANATSASDVVLFVREVVESYPHLREMVVAKIIGYFPTIKVAKVFRVALWILSEYSAEVNAAVTAVRTSLGSLPFVDEDTLQVWWELGCAAANTAAVYQKKGPAVLADGTYATQSAMTALSRGSVVDTGEAPSLRTLLLAGDFYVAAVTASAMTKMVMKLARLNDVKLNEAVAEAMSWVCEMVKVGKSGATPSKMDDDCHERLWLCLMMLNDPHNKAMSEIWVDKCRMSYGQLLMEKQKAAALLEEKNTVRHRQRQRQGGMVVTEIEDEDAMDMTRATGAAEEEDFGSRLKRITQLTGLSDPVYAEAVVTVHEYDIVLDVLLINQLNEPLRNVCLELATVGDLKLCERPQTYTMAPHSSVNVRANIKVSSTETGIIYGNVVYDMGPGTASDANLDGKHMVILSDIHIDIMDYITPAHCSLLQFRCMWAEFEWENKVAVNTSITDPVKYLRHVVACTNMQCL